MVSVLDSSVVDLGFGSNQRLLRLVFVASRLSMQHLKRKSEDWLARNMNNVSE